MPVQSPARSTSNGDLLIPYVLPFALYVGIGAIPPDWGLPRDWNYGLRIVATAAALAWGWKRTLPLRGPGAPWASIAVGLVVGVAATALWVALKEPFYSDEGAAWESRAWALRLVASGTVVALFEELLFRGFLLRAAVQWQEARRAGVRPALAEVLDRRSVNDLPAGSWTPLAVGLSTVAFAAGHHPGEYPAALAYGLVMAGLVIARRDLLACVVAHGTTNVALAWYVASTERWGLW